MDKSLFENIMKIAETRMIAVSPMLLLNALLIFLMEMDKCGYCIRHEPEHVTADEKLVEVISDILSQGVADPQPAESVPMTTVIAPFFFIQKRLNDAVGLPIYSSIVKLSEMSSALLEEAKNWESSEADGLEGSNAETKRYDA